MSGPGEGKAPAETGDMPEQTRAKPGWRAVLASALLLLLIPATVWCGARWSGGRYTAVSLLVLLEAMLPFFLCFESRRPQARELAVIAGLCAVAVAGRAALFMLPQCKPVLAVAIIAGAALGGETGFLVDVRGGDHRIFGRKAVFRQAGPGGDGAVRRGGFRRDLRRAAEHRVCAALGGYADLAAAVELLRGGAADGLRAGGGDGAVFVVCGGTDAGKARSAQGEIPTNGINSKRPGRFYLPGRFFISLFCRLGAETGQDTGDLGAGSGETAA